MESLAPEEEVVRQVAALLERRRTDMARALLKPALANHPDHPDLLLQSAWIDYLDDDNQNALSAVKQVLVSEPSNESARVLYFELLVDEGQHQEAERVIIELLREYPETSNYYGYYANLMLRTLNTAKAAQLAHEGLKYDSDSTECLAAQAICQLIERPGSASHGLQQLIVGHPKLIRTLLLVVVALEQRGDARGAYRFAQELVRAQPDNEHLVAMARELKLKSHWSMLPLWPVQKWGWGASFGIWLFAIVVSRTLNKTYPTAAGVFMGVMLLYVVYSWVWPPLLRRLIK